MQKELAREGLLDDADGESQHSLLEGESGRDELARRVKSLTQLEAVARVAAGVAHDLNNVLAVVETYTGFVKEGALGQQQRHDLEIARNAVVDDPLREHLAMTLVEQRTTGLVWIVGSATVGYSLQVTIDDASGDVVKVEHLGLR